MTAMSRPTKQQRIVNARPFEPMLCERLLALRHRLKRNQGAGLVVLHEAAVADYIGGQNGSKATLDAFFGHPGRRLSKDAVARTVCAPHRGVYRPQLLLRVKLRCGWRANKRPVRTQNRTHVGRVGLSHMCRVEVWRGGCRSNISVAAPFVWRCLTGSAMAPFPHPAHRTGHADFPHPALGQDFTPSPTPRRAPAGSGVRARSARRGARVDKPRPCVA